MKIYPISFRSDNRRQSKSNANKALNSFGNSESTLSKKMPTNSLITNLVTLYVAKRKPTMTDDMTSQIFADFKKGSEEYLKNFQKTKDFDSEIALLNDMAESYVKVRDFQKAGVITAYFVKKIFDNPSLSEEEKHKLIATDDNIYRLRRVFNLNKPSRNIYDYRYFTDSEYNTQLIAIKTMNEIGYKEFLPIAEHLCNEAKYEFDYFSDLHFIKNPELKKEKTQQKEIKNQAKLLINKHYNLALLGDYIRKGGFSSSFEEAAYKLVSRWGIAEHVNIFSHNYTSKDRLKLIASIGDKQYIKECEDVLSTDHFPDYDIICIALDAIGEIGDFSNIQLLKSKLYDSYASYQKHAIIAIAKLKSVKFDSDDENGQIAPDKQKTMDKIIRENNEYKISLITPLLKNKDIEVRSLAIEAIGELGNSNHLPLIIPFMEDKEDAVNKEAYSAIGKLGDISTLGMLKNKMQTAIKNADSKYCKYNLNYIVTAMTDIAYRKDQSLLKDLYRNPRVRDIVIRNLTTSGKTVPAEIINDAKNELNKDSQVENLNRFWRLLFNKGNITFEEAYKIRPDLEDVIADKANNSDVEYFFPILVNGSSYNFTSAFNAICKCGKVDDADLLIKSLSKRNDEASRYKAEGRFGSEYVRPGNVSFLFNSKHFDYLKNEYERFNKVDTLHQEEARVNLLSLMGDIGSKAEQLDYLRSLAKESYSDDQSRIYDAIAKVIVRGDLICDNKLD